MTNALTTTTPLPFASEIERDPRLGSGNTRRSYRSALGRFEAWRAGRQFTETLVEEYLVYLRQDGLSPRSINHALACIRWWARRVAKLAGELASPEDATRIANLAARVTTVKDVKGSRVRTGRHLDDAEIIALMNTCHADPSPAARRDTALIALAWATGARIHELQDLRLEDITYTKDGADLILHGKGDKDRETYLYNGALEALNAWLDVRGVDPGKVFNHIHKGGKIITSLGITLEGLRKILVSRVKQAGIQKRLTWHDFRRTFIGKLFDGGTDISTAQELAGHASPTTTVSYDRRPDQRKRQAVEIATNLTLSIPKKQG